MRNPTQQEVVDAIDRGIRRAQADYKKAAWTALCQGPEHLMTANVFYALAKLTEENCLTLETRVTDVRRYLKGMPQPGRPPSVPRGTGRVDICLWHKDKNRPRAIIEVKRRADAWREQTRPTDIDRIARLLLIRSPRKLGFGILASCIHRVETSNNRDELKRRIDSELDSLLQTIEAELDAQLGVRLEPSRTVRLPLKDEDPEDPESENWLWRPVVFTIYRKRNRG